MANHDKGNVDVSHQALRAWTRLMRVHGHIIGRVEAQLKAAKLPPLVWHDVLLELSQAPDQRMRPNQLQQNVNITQHNLSRLLDRMVARSAIRRTAFDGDKRAQWVELDAPGAKLQKTMWALYSSVLMTEVSANLNDDDARKLGKQLGKLLPP